MITHYRVPNAATEVNFRVRLDARVLQPTDRVLLSGNIPQLHDIDMLPSIHDATIYTATVTLPYAPTDTHVFGLFHYQYVLMSREGRITEGQMHRSDQQLQRQHFHVFRPNSANIRFRNLTAIPSLENQRAYIVFLLNEVEITKSIPQCMALQVAQELLNDFPDATRHTVEGVLGAYIDNCEREVTIHISLLIIN